jgi:hypothetical protein
VERIGRQIDLSAFRQEKREAPVPYTRDTIREIKPPLEDAKINSAQLES